jgi:hypothetical protein
LSLQEQRHAATLGAAKDLVESAAKGVLAYVGSTPGKTDSLGPLYRAALEAVRPEDEPPPDSWSVARGLVAVVAGLAQLRNTAGSGHGRAEPSLAKAQDADLAAASATAAVRYLLAPH